jgi:uncharacterized protein (TIGR02147 family)
MPNIFEFTDYRKYLKAYFDERKASDPKFSHRFLARRLDLSTSNFIMLVMQGKRNLNPHLCFKFSELIGHKPKEASYFENMVQFGNAKSGKEKDTYFNRMMVLRKNLKVARIEESQYEYYSNWYNPIVRELVTQPEFAGDIEELCKSVVPSITLAQARKSIELLLKLGLIREKGEGYEQAAELVATDPEVTSVAVRKFHREMGRLGVEALDRIPKGERNITSCTLALTEEQFEILKRRIEEMRNEAISLAEEGGQRVYQLNLQLFPVSKGPRTKKTKPGQKKARR